MLESWSAATPPAGTASGAPETSFFFVFAFSRPPGFGVLATGCLLLAWLSRRPLSAFTAAGALAGPLRLGFLVPSPV